jgi:Zn-dependent protease
MRLSWRIGRVAGIDVYVHATFLVVFLLFPDLFGGGPEAVLNVLLILALFGCVLLHELGHALMARRFGIGTRDITLYPIGGVARLERMPRAPGAELLIALAGPAVNFAIAAALTMVLFLGAGALSAPGDFLKDLLILNLVLGLFNLIPAFPMDGGRVLRALLSGWLGRAAATTIASRVGRVLAVCFGVFALVRSHNMIHVALAAFIYFAARAEEGQVLYEEKRRGLSAHDQGIWTAPPGYRWVSCGNGTWQLAPITVGSGDHHQNASSWR